jgi:chemotaxis protein MotB
VSKDRGKKIVIVRKKKGHDGGHHGGSWKVAYADFVTAMMAFFLVMWILGMDEDARNAVEGYFSNPVGYRKGYSSGNSPLSAGNSPAQLQSNPIRLIMRASEQERLERVGAKIQERLLEESGLRNMLMLVEIITTEQGLRIELVEAGDGETFFAVGSTDLKPMAETVLRLIGEELDLLSNPLVVEGHTDAAAFSTPGYTNWELSTDRANAARQVLETSGVSPDRILEIRGYGATRPRVPADPLDAANRRISILLPFTTNAPDAEEGRPSSAV